MHSTKKVNVGLIMYMCICLFFIKIQISELILMIYGMEVLLKGGKVLGDGLSLGPQTQQVKWKHLNQCLAPLKCIQF